MLPFIIIAGVSVIAIGLVLWLVNKEDTPKASVAKEINPQELFKEQNVNTQAPLTPTAVKAKHDSPPKKSAIKKASAKQGGIQNIFQKLLRKTSKTDDLLKTNPFSDLKNSNPKEDWKDKYTHLDGLFQEKSAALEKTQQDLENGLKNQEDFNKVKGILEQELKDVKAKAKEERDQLMAVKEEKGLLEKRIIQLEARIKELEGDKTVVPEEQKSSPEVSEEASEEPSTHLSTSLPVEQKEKGPLVILDDTAPKAPPETTQEKDGQ